MNFFSLFINRPVGTVLLAAGILLAGVVGFLQLAVSPLPQVEFSTLQIYAALPGASAETMAATVATPLERTLGRIAGVTDMTSANTLGTTRITLQFDLGRDIDGAARDVQAAINAARADLPPLPRNPSYRKVNPADAPILILALSSDSATQGQLYDAASTHIAQRLLQLQGVGDVQVGGSSLPAIRIAVNPAQLSKYGISLEALRVAIASNNTSLPKGALENDRQLWHLYANDQLRTVADYENIIVDYKNNAPVRVADVAEVSESVQDERNEGSANGKPAVLLVVQREPGANVIDTVDRVKAALPKLKEQIPASMNLGIALDASPTIRASVKRVEHALLISVVLVVLVVFIFLRSARATLIPAVVVPISLIGTFAVMYLCGFSLNNLSLMALAVAVGFVVDDAIVVLENIARHMEAGKTPFEAALVGTREVGLTVLSMSLSLVAVFIPILLMGGLPGRIAGEFGITLSAAIIISLLVSLSVTPMMCARLLRQAPSSSEGNGPLQRFHRASADFLQHLADTYSRTLRWALQNPGWLLLLLVITIAVNVQLYAAVPKGFFPQQDTGRLTGTIQADQSISFQAMRSKLAQFMGIVQRDPAVASVMAFTGGSRTNSGSMFIALKPLSEREDSADEVINRLRDALAHEPGATLTLQAAQDLQTSGRSTSGRYQFSLRGDDAEILQAWESKIRQALANLPQLKDVFTDAQEKGAQTSIVVDRDEAARLGVSMRSVDAMLGDAFAQRQISIIYEPLNQYRVVMELAPEFRQGPESLQQLFMPAANGTLVPFSAFARYVQGAAPLAVNRQSGFVSSTISFNLARKVSLSQATDAIQDVMRRIGVPSSIHASFKGSASIFSVVIKRMPWLILAAIVTVYILLGILYESFLHPLTIISTLPSAGVGALAALILLGREFNIVAFIGVLLLIGVVMKNAIMMIDVAIDAERREGLSPQEAIFKGCVIRFRPIMMTALAAMMGAVPLAIGTGEGAELGHPLGISIIGGLLVSQLLTLYTTPVVYLYLDRLKMRCRLLLKR